jgi:hypothetical protein
VEDIGMTIKEERLQMLEYTLLRSYPLGVAWTGGHRAIFKDYVDTWNTRKRQQRRFYKAYGATCVVYAEDYPEVRKYLYKIANPRVPDEDTFVVIKPRWERKNEND